MLRLPNTRSFLSKERDRKKVKKSFPSSPINLSKKKKVKLDVDIPFESFSSMRSENQSYCDDTFSGIMSSHWNSSDY